jgi:hypothetical protein
MALEPPQPKPRKAADLATDDVIYVRAVQRSSAEGTMVLTFALPALEMLRPDGSSQLIPNPMGKGLASFDTLEEAIFSCHQAGYGVQYEKQIYPVRRGASTHARGSSPTHAERLKAILQMELESCQEALLHQLRDREKSVLAAVITALGERRQQIPVAELLLFLQEDDAEVRQALANTLALAGPKVLEDLQKQYQTHQQAAAGTPGFRCRLAIAQTLQALVERYPLAQVLSALSLLRLFLMDEHWLIRAQAATALGIVMRKAGETSETSV